MPPPYDPTDPLEGFRTLLDRSPDMLFRVRLGETPRFEFVSRAAMAIAGYSAEALMADIGLLANLVTDEVLEAAPGEGPGMAIPASSMLALPPEELPDRLRVPIRRPDGTRAWVDVDLAVTRDAAGVAVSIDGAVRDVTEIVAAGRRVAFEARILAAIADAVVVTDADARITFWNPGAERIFGLEAAAVLGRSMAVMFPDGRGQRPRGAQRCRQPVRALGGRRPDDRCGRIGSHPGGGLLPVPRG